MWMLLIGVVSQLKVAVCVLFFFPLCLCFIISHCPPFFFLVIITDYFLNVKLIYLRFLDFCQLRLYIHAKIQLI